MRYLEYYFALYKDIRMLIYLINDIGYLTKDTNLFVKVDCAGQVQSLTFVI